MKQILWFRRDLRIEDNEILKNAKDKVLPIFIFDKNILSKLPKNDKRVYFIYKSVLNLKKELKKIGLDLKIFFDEPKNVFNKLKEECEEVLCSIDFDSYTIKRDKEIEEIIPLKRYLDSFIINPKKYLKKDNTPYKVFTPFYKSLSYIWESNHLEEAKRNEKLKLIKYSYEEYPTLEEIGFEETKLPLFLECSNEELLKEFENKLKDYKKDRDFFFIEATSNFAVHLRFGIFSPKMIFNRFKNIPNSEHFIMELFWREFWNYCLYHNPKSENENWNGLKIEWSDNKEYFKAWCEGKTGVPIVDAAMRKLNETGTMHNRLRMIVASFLTKNLFINWKWGEEYFALKLLDYEKSSNVGSWQWSASTGADAAPYFRIFNPLSQSEKFDKEGIFIKSVIPELKEVNPKLFHKENGLTEEKINYPKSIVNVKKSRQEAIDKYKEFQKQEEEVKKEEIELEF